MRIGESKMFGQKETQPYSDSSWKYDRLDYSDSDLSKNENLPLWKYKRLKLGNNSNAYQTPRNLKTTIELYN